MAVRLANQYTREAILCMSFYYPYSYFFKLSVVLAVLHFFRVVAKRFLIDLERRNFRKKNGSIHHERLAREAKEGLENEL